MFSGPIGVYVAVVGVPDIVYVNSSEPPNTNPAHNPALSTGGWAKFA